MSETILTRENAQELVAKIRSDNGGVSPDDEAGLKRDYPAVWEALRSVRRKLGSATKTLATNLYSKDTRFLYELIQNADDNQYTRADANSHDPFISFSLYPDRLVIDCNEDGFTAENVKALCSIGQSTKTVAQGYIGEKGIGFKSVFKIAQRVHVQSGLFSFSFQYTPDFDDDGLGMVTPLAEPYEVLPETVGTRMTLGLLRSLDFSTRAEELSNIPDTLLLFLRKLRSIQVNVYPATGDATEIKYSCYRGQGQGLEITEKQSRSNHGTWTVEKRNFRVTRRTIEDLPDDAARQHTNKADVVLAFPVNETSDEVVLQKQHVFAYLPLRPVGFNLLIQSDFITQASREDVVHSERNLALLVCVAATFGDAVLQFCGHDTLQYQWMRYLPDDSVSDEFWARLRPLIKLFLIQTPVLRSWSGRLCQPGQLGFLTPDARDQYGEPLFADLPTEIYLSPCYTFNDFQLLKDLGTRIIHLTDILNVVKADLERPNSKFKTTTPDDDWHSRVAKLFCNGFEFMGSHLRSLCLIPLVDKSWIAAQDNAIYFPTTGLSEIPTNLELKLVDPAAVKNASRRNLFTRLGVMECDPTFVISEIYRYHASLKSCNVLDEIPHLRFLFFNLPADSRLNQTFFVCSEGGGYALNLRTHSVYNPDRNDAYDPKSVFQPQVPSISPYPANFIHPLYLTAVSIEARSHGMSFPVWLEDFAGVKRIPQIHTDSGEPSKELDYILTHRSEILLGLLKKYWLRYADVITNPIEKSLKESKVPSLSGAPIQLQGSYMPLPRLKSLAEGCGVLHAFSFVSAPSDLQDEDEESWKFLTQFGVRFLDDVDFYMKLLDIIASSDEQSFSPRIKESIFMIYSSIMKRCVTEEDVNSVRHYFKSQKRIYVPSSQENIALWECLEDCVWDGPDWLVATSRISAIPEYQGLKHLLKNILAMRDAIWRDSLHELVTMSTKSVKDHTKVLQIYNSLWRDFEKDSNHAALRLYFEVHNLVFVPSRNAWFPPSACLWVDNRTQIPGKVPIGTPYASLRDFSNRMLQVQKPDLQMYTQALKQLSTEKPPSVPRIKESISLISAMDPSADDLKGLRSANILPVRLPSGEVKLTNATVDFAIVDRKEYGEAFKHEIITLDFSFNEVHTCSPFLLALGLGRRFMSAAVEEKTMVQGGVLNLPLTNLTRQKAHALVRISVHFNSAKARERDQTLFDLFRRATVFASERISKSISLTQNLRVYTVERNRAHLHFEEYEDQLKLYVPADRRDQELCYLQQLPKRILHFLSISDHSAEAVLVKVLGSSSIYIVDAILEEAGIIELEYPVSNGVNYTLQPYEIRISSAIATSHDVTSGFTEDEGNPRAEHLHDQSRQNDGRPLSNGPHSSLRHDSSERTVLYQSESVARLASSLGHMNADFSGNGNALPTAGLELGRIPSTTLVGNGGESVGVSHEDREYAELLNRVVNAASTAHFPTHDQVVNTHQSNSTTIFGVRSMNRDRKVGAAGELYSFEILRDLQLPDFDTSNWRSTIRKEVRVCDKYRDLEPWNGSETSDIVYTDHTGSFTRFLVEAGYLSSETAVSARPTYYLEVKTTTGQCKETFFMSGSQYKRMKRMALKANSENSEIYVLLRVYNIENEGIGMKVYLDPFKAKEEKELVFTVNTWAVQPMMET